jgi:antitoxin ParD1/3/4
MTPRLPRPTRDEFTMDEKVRAKGRSAREVSTMTITLTLTPEQEAWLAAHVASGDFASTEDAIRRMIAAAVAEHAELEHDDLAWAKPYVDQALAEVERGEAVTLEEHDTQIDALMAKLEG